MATVKIKSEQVGILKKEDVKTFLEKKYPDIKSGYYMGRVILKKDAVTDVFITVKKNSLKIYADVGFSIKLVSILFFIIGYLIVYVFTIGKRNQFMNDVVNELNNEYGISN